MTSPNLPAKSNIGKGLAAAIPQDQRAELLRVQADSIHSAVELTQLKILGSGVGKFELSDNPGKLLDGVTGVILHAHPSNVLWDKPYGARPDPSDPLAALPACSSNDDIYGIPREGFAHAGLPNGETGDGIKRVACATCPYNQWGTGNLFAANKNPKGKAVANQRRIYIMLPGREKPVTLTVPPTSIREYDRYSDGFLDQSIPVQFLLTRFYQTVEGPPTNRYGIVHFEAVEELTEADFQLAMKKRERYRASIFPAQPASATIVDGAEITPSNGSEEDEDIPF